MNRFSQGGARTAGVVAFFVCAAVLASCRTPVGVKRVDARSVHKSLTANVLSTGEPSAPSAWSLHQRGSFARYQQKPAEVLARMHAELPEARDPDELLFSLSELSFAHAEKGGGQPYFLASAVYAYAFLFAEKGSWPPDAFDPRFRLAVDLYNRGLTESLLGPDNEPAVDLSPRRLALPFGQLALQSEVAEFRWAGYRLGDFVPVAEVQIRGLRNRYRRTGVGVPLAASIVPLAEGDAVRAENRFIPPAMKVPVTAFVRISRPRASLTSGTELTGRVELYTADQTETVRVGHREVPLEAETTAAIAYSLAESPVWNLELQGYRRGDFNPTDLEGNLAMLQPHRPGRIPLVLVHGTASSPGRWAEMLNELSADPVLRKRYEFWFFFYNTGTPILFSANLLRKELASAVALIDPEGRDPALRRMVVAGHSQGGLLARLQVTDSGDRFWSNVSDRPLDELELELETRELLQEALFFDVNPYVSRVVFIATPHRGSFLAGRRLAGLATRLVSLPVDMAKAGRDLFDQDPASVTQRKIEDIPTSVDNMRPGHPFIVTLAGSPIHAKVEAHSIIPVRSKGPLLDEHDGVVRYSSAHIEGVASEKIVISGHSVQGHPECIAELRRILYLHLEASDAATGR